MYVNGAKQTPNQVLMESTTLGQDLNNLDEYNKQK